MSLDELVDMYNQKLNSYGGRSTIATDPSHHTPQSMFTTNTGFDSVVDTANIANAANIANTMINNNNNNFAFTENEASALLFDTDSYRFHLNDRVLAGDIIRPPTQNPPRVEHIKFTDTLVFSSSDAAIDDYEHNEEYTKRYPDVKPKLTIINAQQAQIPPANIHTNPGDEIQRLVQQGVLRNLHGYIKYPYNYIEPPWYFNQLDEQQGFVNLQPPRSYLTARDIAINTIDESHNMQLPHGVPQNPITQDRYELIPLPKMVYENFVPLIAARRIVYHRQTPGRVAGEAPSQNIENSFVMASLPEVEEMTVKV
ncbi:unnamed protein product [Rotaria sordida]|uniref:Uncharacterized protein n=1 Tax=Rotaria sordida TaxID=392033 RepID=A0A819A619_9BILA|nr:unnamed protein product [Rotaria sordida]CAF0879286.1 unnamed protein product [Rotaria sordida]CAF0900826.1 unnamed protein product [Rotaria sordida]CAF3624267.1 unnamed protein product [Rotaria sordida]CAF3715702.1 unnamed protein product [Rotaria sordida]